ncbi:MAG TPA: hypothetical protein VIG55_09345 [Methylosinus sp.]|jgi:hypothetical protein
MEPLKLIVDIIAGVVLPLVSYLWPRAERAMGVAERPAEARASFFSIGLLLVSMVSSISVGVFVYLGSYKRSDQFTDLDDRAYSFLQGWSDKYTGGEFDFKGADFDEYSAYAFIKGKCGYEIVSLQGRVATTEENTAYLSMKASENLSAAVDERPLHDFFDLNSGGKRVAARPVASSLFDRRIGAIDQGDAIRVEINELDFPRSFRIKEVWRKANTFSYPDRLDGVTYPLNRVGGRLRTANLYLFSDLEIRAVSYQSVS